MYNEFIYGFKTWFLRVRDKKNYESSEWQTHIAHFDRKPFQYRSLTKVMKMHNSNIEGKIYYSVIDWTSSIAIAATCFPSFPFWSPFVHSLENHDLGLQYTISKLSLLTASSTSSIIAAATPILFKSSTWWQSTELHNRKWQSFYPAFIPTHALFEEKAGK